MDVSLFPLHSWGGGASLGKGTDGTTSSGGRITAGGAGVTGAAGVFWAAAFLGICGSGFFGAGGITGSSAGGATVVTTGEESHFLPSQTAATMRQRTIPAVRIRPRTR